MASKNSSKNNAKTTESKNNAKAPEQAAPKAPTHGPDWNGGRAKDGMWADLPANAEQLPVHVLVPNPKRGAPAQRFALYKPGMTVAQALAAGVWRADLRWDLAHGFIQVGGKAPKAAPVQAAPKAAPTPKAPKADKAAPKVAAKVHAARK